MKHYIKNLNIVIKISIAVFLTFGVMGLGNKLSDVYAVKCVECGSLFEK